MDCPKIRLVFLFCFDFFFVDSSFFIYLFVKMATFLCVIQRVKPCESLSWVQAFGKNNEEQTVWWTESRRADRLNRYRSICKSLHFSDTRSICCQPQAWSVHISSHEETWDFSLAFLNHIERFYIFQMYTASYSDFKVSLLTLRSLTPTILRHYWG